MFKKLALAMSIVYGLVAGIPALAQSGNPLQANQVAGEIMVSEYGKWSVTTLNAIVVGSNTVNFAPCFIHVGTANRQVFPFWAQGAQALNVPIQVQDGTLSESVTSETAAAFPTSAIVPPTVQPYSCSFTATFANAHSAGVQIGSGDGGLAEAMNDALSLGAGAITIDQTANVTYSALTTLLVYPNIQIVDKRSPQLQYWNPTPAAATSLSAPIALTSSTVAASGVACTPVGSCYAAGTIHVAYALVDAMGNEGPISADYNFTDTSAKGVLFNSPPAAVGAVGYIPYIGLESGASGHEYQMLVYTQPTVLGALPVANGICTLTTIETATPACALTNAAYGQTGSAASVVAYPVVTSPQQVGTGGLSTASYYIGNTNSRTVYNYAPSFTPNVAQMVKSAQAFHITTAAASTVPQILGTLAIPSGAMNYVGRTLQVCGEAYSSTQGASTIVSIEFEWDAQGSDVTTGLPVILGGPLVTNTLTTGTVAYFSFCETLQTTVASASATGGTIYASNGWLIESALSSGSTPAAGPSITTAAVGSLNLAAPARLQVVMVQTTSSTAVPQLLNLTAQWIN